MSPTPQELEDFARVVLRFLPAELRHADRVTDLLASPGFLKRIVTPKAAEPCPTPVTLAPEEIKPGETLPVMIAAADDTLTYQLTVVAYCGDAAPVVWPPAGTPPAMTKFPAPLGGSDPPHFYYKGVPGSAIGPGCTVVLIVRAVDADGNTVCARTATVTVPPMDADQAVLAALRRIALRSVVGCGCG